VVGAETNRAYVFQRSSTGWIETDELTVNGTVSDDYFASSVFLDYGQAIVGAPGEEANTGAAYVFVIPEPSTTTMLMLLGLAGVVWSTTRIGRARLRRPSARAA